MATSSGSISSNVGPLNVGELVKKLMEVESKSKTAPLAKKAEGINAAISALGNLKAALSTYQTSINGLNPANFSTLKASIANAGTGSGLTADAVSAEVNTDEQTKKLSQKLQSQGFADGHVFTAGSVMAIKVGKNPPTFITLKADATVTGLRDAINAAKAGVTATVVKDASGERLVLESNTAGIAGALQIKAMGSLASLSNDPASGQSTMKQIQAPRDDTKASAGEYAISVSQLAQAHKLNSSGIAVGATFDDGILAIKSGNGTTALIRPTGNSLANVRDAINASGSGVNASIINDGTHDRLIISAEKSGAANVIKITGTGSYSVFAFDPASAGGAPGQGSAPGMSEVAKAQDAKLTLDGVAITSETNSIKNVLSGVQLSLSKVTTKDDKLILKIANDNSGLTTAATSFVSAYNALVKVVGDLTKFTPGSNGEKGTSAPLANESIVRNMMAQLRGALMAPVGEGNGLTHLSRAGISFQKNGTLELDSGKLKEVSSKNFEAVGELFGSKQGLVPRMQKLMEQMLGNEGVVEKKKEGLRASLKITEGRYEDASRRLDSVRDQITAKFNRLNVALAQAQQRGDYMLKQLDNLSKSR